MSDWLAQKVAQRVLADDEDRDVPKTVKRYVEEHKEQGMDEEKAWAISWSRYCKYKYPNSPHCKKDPDEYFSGRDSSSNRVATRISDSMTYKTMVEYREASVLVEFNELRSETRHEIISWLQERGEQVNDVTLSKGTITSDADKEKWLQTKQKEPRPEIVDELCEIGSIRRPIVVDMDHDILVWGRHRLAAALECDLNVPVITIDRQVAGRIVSRMLENYR